MEITSVKVYKTDRESSRLKGFATVIIDNCFVVKNIRIIEGDEKLFIAMPSTKVALYDEAGHPEFANRYRDVVHPLNSETRKMFEDAIFEEYNNPKNTDDGE